MIVNEGGGGKKLPTLTTPGVAANLLSGKQLIDQNGAIVTGAMTNRGNVSQSLNAGGSYTIPAGYHAGGGKVTANSLASQTSATATAADIRSGKTAWVNGSRITGTGKMAGERVRFGFLCEGTNDDIEVYTDIALMEEEDERYIIPAGSTRAWTLECTLNSIVSIYFANGMDDVIRAADRNGFSRLDTVGGTPSYERGIDVLCCIDTNATLRVTSN